jgi:hypothetical protein
MFPRKPEAILLASGRELGWNAQSFTLPVLMREKKYLLPDFDACSVALFATLALTGAPLPSRAQMPAPPPPITAPDPGRAPSGANAAPSASTPIPPNRWRPEELGEAFRRADTNSDNRLSREEAAVWPGLARHFDRYDSNKDGSISSAEFDEALK